MSIIEPVIRPPAERKSFLLQLTLGCSDNHCGFCGAYKNKPFKIKDTNEIMEDIDSQANQDKDIRRVFLMDGDALIIKNNRLIPILEKLEKTFPKLSRISSYANGYNITQRNIAELKELYEQKLRLIYIGLESGSQDVLNIHSKKSSAVEMIAAVNKAKEAGIKSSVMVLLGIGGKKYSKIHIKETIKALNLMQPIYLSFLSVMVIEGTPLAKMRQDTFQELTPLELLKESYGIIKGLKLDKTIFRSNHASNYLPLEGTLPKDKANLLNTIEAGIKGDINLKPEFLRGL